MLNASNASVHFLQLDDDANQQSQHSIDYTFSIGLVFIFLLSLIFNTVSVVTILAARVFTPINLLILNLAIADLTYTFGIPMFIAHAFMKSWPFGQLGCKLFIFTEFFGITVGILSVTALSVERYFEIVDKKKRAHQLSNKFKNLLVVVYILVTWTIGLGYSLPFINGIRLDQHDQNYGCGSDWSDQSVHMYFTLKLVLVFLVPCVIITVSSLKLLVFLNRWKLSNRKFFYSISSYEIDDQSMTSFAACPTIDSSFVITPRKESSRTTTSVNNNLLSTPRPIESESVSSSTSNVESSLKTQSLRLNKQKQDQQASCGKFGPGKHTSAVRQKACRLVLTIVILFFIQWSPLCIFQLIMLNATEFIAYAHIINLVVSTLSYSNTVANPMIYVFFTYNFKVYKETVSKFLSANPARSFLIIPANKNKSQQSASNDKLMVASNL